MLNFDGHFDGDGHGDVMCNQTLRVWLHVPMPSPSKVNIVPMVTGRMGARSILPVKVSAIIGTILIKLDNDVKC